jgi:hypothetical protein
LLIRWRSQKENFIQHATPEWGSLSIRKKEECACFYRIGSQRERGEESETRWMNKKRTLLLNFFFFSIWLFRLEQWRRQRVPAGPPVSQHARRARPLIGRSEHGSSSRFFLQRHRFLSAHCPSQRKGITLTNKFNIWINISKNRKKFYSKTHFS